MSEGEATPPSWPLSPPHLDFLQLLLIIQVLPKPPGHLEEEDSTLFVSKGTFTPAWGKSSQPLSGQGRAGQGVQCPWFGCSVPPPAEASSGVGTGVTCVNPAPERSPALQKETQVSSIAASSISLSFFFSPFCTRTCGVILQDSFHELCPVPPPQLGACSLALGWSFPGSCLCLWCCYGSQYRHRPIHVFFAAKTPL